MIAWLQGRVLEKGIDYLILDVGGVGYRVYLSLVTLADLPSVGEEVSFRVHTNVSETAFDLYGFSDSLEEAVFHCLIGAPNIGCKKAMQILSGLPAVEIVTAVRAGDIASLSKAHGVGKKTAERLVVELRDRVSSIAIPNDKAGKDRRQMPHSSSIVLENVTSGLVGLGFKPEQARLAAEATIEEADSEELPVLLRDALRRLRKS